MAKADAVLVWLGPHDDSSQTALKLADTVSDGYKKIPEDIRPRAHFAFNDTTLHSVLGVEPISIKGWHAVIRAFSRTWCRRIWMVQDVALSHRLHFMCGEEGIGWLELVALAKWIDTIGWDVELKHQMLRKGLGSDMLYTGLLLLLFDVASSVGTGVGGVETRELMRSFFGVEDVEKACAAILGVLVLRIRIESRQTLETRFMGFWSLQTKFHGQCKWKGYFRENARLRFLTI